MEESLERILPDIDKSTTQFYVNHMHLHGIETGMHEHKKGQLLYAEGGIVHIFIEDKHWYLPSRCFMWIPANMPHSILSFSKNVELYNIYFSVENKDDEFFRTPNIYFVSDLLREMILYSKDWQGPIKEKNAAAYTFLKAIKVNLPIMGSSRLPINMQHPFPKDTKLVEIALFLNDHIETNYTIEQVAQHFGISVRTLSRKFKEGLGMNYVRFARSLRITRAFQYIAEGKYNMYEIAFMVGYGSLAAFSNVFYQVAGIRPTDYAKLLHKK